MTDSYSEEDYNLDKIINEEFKVWKKNTPYLYDLIITKALEWPSLTVDWFPAKTVEDEGNFSTYQLLLGTHTNPQDGKDYEQNYVMTTNVRIPNQNTNFLDQSYLNTSKIEFKQFINHPGEINRARVNPVRHEVIATKTIGSEVLVFMLNNHPINKPKHSKVKADIVLEGHIKREGNSYGLAWNPLKSHQLLSGSDDGLICLWSIDGMSFILISRSRIYSELSIRLNTKLAGTINSGKMNSHSTFRYHRDVVEDVAWHPMHDSIFGSVGDDKLFILWDTRKKPDSPVAVIEAHPEEINCLSFNPYDGVYCVTGSNDKTLSLWDIRNIKSHVHSFENHSGEVTSVQWAPFKPNIFASGGGDRRVCVWDVSKVGIQTTEDDLLDGPPELLFIHGGHTGKVTDLSWNPSPKDPWMCASTSDDNILQIWQINNTHQL